MPCLSRPLSLSLVLKQFRPTLAGTFSFCLLPRKAKIELRAECFQNHGRSCVNAIRTIACAIIIEKFRGKKKDAQLNSAQLGREDISGA